MSFIIHGGAIPLNTYFTMFNYLKTLFTTDLADVPLTAINLFIIIGSLFLGLLIVVFIFASFVSLFSNLFK